MSDTHHHDPHPSPEDLRAAEKSVADSIEAAVSVPSSIEEQALLDAAELEEIETGE